jgi:tetratricopeptide (TPR) repeat protein
MTREVEILMQQGKWQEALAECQKLIQQQPAIPKLHGYLGFCYMKLNQIPQAEAAFRKAITLDPNYWEAGIKLAQCLDRMMKYKEALQIAEHYQHMRPNDPALASLVNGLRRQAGAVEEESWQKSVKGGWHNITLSQE